MTTEGASQASNVIERLLSQALDTRLRVNTLLAAKTEIRKTRLDPWWDDMLDHFAGEISFCSSRLTALRDDWRDLPLLAFSARSMLELAVWVRFCCQSPANARRFYEDKFRDGDALLGSLEELATAVDTTEESVRTAKAASMARARIRSLAQGAGATDIGSCYTRVADAAARIGEEDAYRRLNQILSKLAHPTAMIVLNYVTPDCMGSLQGISGFVRVIGYAQEIVAWATLEQYLAKLS